MNDTYRKDLGILYGFVFHYPNNSGNHSFQGRSVTSLSFSKANRHIWEIGDDNWQTADYVAGDITQSSVRYANHRVYDNLEDALKRNV